MAPCLSQLLLFQRVMVFIENTFWQVTVDKSRNYENKKELMVKITLTSLSGINLF